MRLALRMGRTLRELLATIDSAELTQWLAFDELEPLGADADDYRAALPAAVYINANRAQGAAAVHPLDLLPWSARQRREPVQLDDDALVDAFDRLVGLNG